MLLKLSDHACAAKCVKCEEDMVIFQDDHVLYLLR